MTSKYVKVETTVENQPFVRRVRDVLVTDLDNDDTTIIRSSNNVADLSPLGEVFQDDLATDANGTAIDAAVNNLRDVLVAAGLMEAEA